MKSFMVFLFVAACAVAVPLTWCGIFRSDGSYIPGSHLVWAEVANIAKRWSDPDGIPILTEWHDAAQYFDDAMTSNQLVDAIGHLYIIAATQKLVQPYIKNLQCRQRLVDSHLEFGKLVHGLAKGTVSWAQVNDYMIKDYPRFGSACGNPQAYNNNYYYQNYPYSSSC